MLKAPFVVSAVAVTVHDDAPESAASTLTVGVPTNTVVPTPAPRFIAPVIVHAFAFPPEVLTDAII